MTLLTTSLIIIATALTLTVSNSPITLGLWILGLALCTSIFLRLSITSWLGIFIFLVYIGGLLIIFSYFVALRPNQYIRLKFPFLRFILSVIILTPLLLLPINFNYSLSRIKIPAIRLLLHLDNIPIFCLIGLTLFLALVAVVKIRGGSTSPLRPYNS